MDKNTNNHEIDVTEVDLDSRVANLNRIFDERGEDIQIRLQSVWKNNTMLDGLSVQVAGMNAAPTIYPNEKMLSMSDEELADEISRILDENPGRDVDLSFLMDPEYVMEHVMPKIINAETNMPGIEQNDIAYVPLDDLGFVCVFYLPVPDFDKDGSTASCTLHFKHLESLDIPIHELYERSLSNIAEDVEFKSMNEVLLGFIPADGAEIPEDVDELMYVLSNHSKTNGAAAILSEKVQEMIADTIGADYWIIPASINELIIVKKGTDPADTSNAETFLEMIKDVNDSQVAVCDLLSYNLYYHDGTAGLKMIAAA